MRATTSVPLGALEKKYSLKSLVDFLRQPHASRNLAKLTSGTWWSSLAKWISSRLRCSRRSRTFESKNAGYEMIRTNGLSCIACHEFNGQKSGEMSALDDVLIPLTLPKDCSTLTREYRW